ncbi:MAG: MaoC/PaaZ C-terminal domain-containing protein [Anaerotignum sp.]
MSEYKFKGKYLEDFEVGAKFYTQSRTITETDIVNFAALSGDYTMLHTSEEYAKTTIHGGRIAHGLLTLSVSSGLIILSGLLEGTAQAYMGSKVKFLFPVRAGDTIHTVTEVVNVHKSKRQYMGVITVINRTLNQNDVVVLEQEDTVMIKSHQE